MDYETDTFVEAHSKQWAENQAAKMRKWAQAADFGYLQRELQGKPRTLTPIDQLF
jgi:hypothetical protein